MYMYIFILWGMVYMCTRDAHVGLYRSIRYVEYLINPHHHHPPHLHQNWYPLLPGVVTYQMCQRDHYFSVYKYKAHSLIIFNLWYKLNQIHQASDNGQKKTKTSARFFSFYQENHMVFLLRWQHICDSQQNNAEKIVRWHYTGDVSIVEQHSKLQCCFYESDWLTDDRCMDYVNVKTGLCLLRENFQQTSFQKFLESFAAGPLVKQRIKFPTWHSLCTVQWWKVRSSRTKTFCALQINNAMHWCQASDSPTRAIFRVQIATRHPMATVQDTIIHESLQASVWWYITTYYGNHILRRARSISHVCFPFHLNKVRIYPVSTFYRSG